MTERELRKVRSPGGAEVKQISVQHTFQVVTFDISVKRRGQLPQDEREERAHPTWLEQAIADGTVLYVSKHIGHTQRTFYHERYVNMRGKTIDVRPHDKRIPMSVLRLKQTIYQAVAEQGQAKRSNESGQPG